MTPTHAHLVGARGAGEMGDAASRAPELGSGGWTSGLPGTGTTRSARDERAARRAVPAQRQHAGGEPHEAGDEDPALLLEAEVRPGRGTGDEALPERLEGDGEADGGGGAEHGSEPPQGDGPLAGDVEAGEDAGEDQGGQAAEEEDALEGLEGPVTGGDDEGLDRPRQAGDGGGEGGGLHELGHGGNGPPMPGRRPRPRGRTCPSRRRDRPRPPGGDDLLPEAEAAVMRPRHHRPVPRPRSIAAAPGARDAALAAVAVAAVLAELTLRDLLGPLPLLAAASFATLALRHRAPLVAPLGIAAAVALEGAAGGGVLLDPAATPLVVLVLAAAGVGRQARHTWQPVAGTAALVLAATAANQLAGRAYTALDDLVFFTLVLGAPAALGVLLRRRAHLLAELRARAAELEDALAAGRAAATAEERARVALALHDALAHRIGEIALQAAGAERLAERDPGQARQALAAAERTGREALDAIRDAIGVLRRGAAPEGAGALPLPAPWRPAAAAEGTRSTAGTGEPLPERPRPGPGPAGTARARTPRAVTLHDAAPAGAIAAALLIEVLTSSKLEGPAAVNVLGVLATAAPLALRRHAPLPAVTATFAAAALQSAFLTPLGLLVTPIVLLLVPAFAVAVHAPGRPAVAGLLVCLAGSAVLEPSPVTGALGLVAWLAGRAVRDRGDKAAALAATNDRLARTRGAHVALARGEERVRLARELHDAIAHRLTVVVLQAGAAQRVWDADPPAARAATAALGHEARAALGELRATLADEDAHDPGDLQALVARMGSLGLDVELTVAPEARHLPAATAATAFRVVQEALTNAIRHAAPTAVDVRLDRRNGHLHVAVVDGGRLGAPQDAPPGAGSGLSGMAERVAALGGTLDAGPEGPGFAVRATLPA